jgi:hypothetical protein
MIFHNSGNNRNNRIDLNTMISNSHRQNYIGRTQHQRLEHEIHYDKPKPKEMKWGAPTWFLLHTLAEKVKDDSFNNIKIQLFDVIKNICSNLPCPKCSAHAIDFFKKINFDSIHTKQDLKIMLFQFHNEVNSRKGFALFNESELVDKYSNAVTINIIHNFMYFFQEKSRNVDMISLNLYRERLIKDLKKWFNNNIQYFNL